jgi:hypothetical protein
MQDERFPQDRRIPDAASPAPELPELTAGESKAIDGMLADLARDCAQAEAPDRLRQRILSKAGPVLASRAASTTDHRPQSGYVSARWWLAGAALAASLALTVMLWQRGDQPMAVPVDEKAVAGSVATEEPPSLRAGSRDEATPDGIGNTATTASVPRGVPTDLDTGSSGSVSSGAVSSGTGASRIQPDRVAATKQREEPAMSATAGGEEAEDPAEQAPALPPLQWPAEVLAAAQRMAASEFATHDMSTGSGQEAEWPGAEIPLRSVRLQMPADDLWRMGLATMPGPPNRQVTADFLVQDNGRPLAVRLVRMEP